MTHWRTGGDGGSGRLRCLWEAPPSGASRTHGSDTALRRNVALRGSDVLFRVGRLVRTGGDGEIAAHGREYLTVLHRAVSEVLIEHGLDPDGGCAACGRGRGPWRRPARYPCPVRRAVLGALAGEAGDEG